MFTADAGIMFSVIYPAKVADYEAVMARIKEALAKSTDPKRKQQALGWRVIKGVEAGPDGNVVYISWSRPAGQGRRVLGDRHPARSVPQRSAGATSGRKC